MESKNEETSGIHKSSCHFQIDNSGSVLEKIANLYAEKLMSDLVLVVGNREYPAHRLILCASSDVFQVMLMNPEWNESREHRIVLQEAPECVEVFEFFLKYLYTGQLKVSHSTVLPILVLADKYNIKDLIYTCRLYMKHNIVSSVKENCLVSWLQYCLTCSHEEVSHLCMNHFKWNFEQMSASEEFGNCDLSLIVMLLSQHDIVIQDEMTLYRCISDWLQKQEERLLNASVTSSCEMENVPDIGKGSLFKERKYLKRVSTHSSTFDINDQLEYLTYEVMKYIRFPMMTPRQLADLLLVPLTLRYKEFFVTRMAMGMSFHSGQWSRVKELLYDPDPANNLLFYPRLYTAEPWSTCLTVDNFPLQPPYHMSTLFFSTPASSSDYENDSQVEWIVELYPKGVWFRKFFLIVWQGTMEVPEVVLRTVRLSITAKVSHYVRVRISVLIYACRDSIEHVANVITTTYVFTPNDQLLNLDDLLPFQVLNDPKERQNYLLDPCNSLKIHIVISPLNDMDRCS